MPQGAIRRQKRSRETVYERARKSFVEYLKMRWDCCPSRDAQGAIGLCTEAKDRTSCNHVRRARGHLSSKTSKHPTPSENRRNGAPTPEVAEMLRGGKQGCAIRPSSNRPRWQFVGDCYLKRRLYSLASRSAAGVWAKMCIKLARESPSGGGVSIKRAIDSMIASNSLDLRRPTKPIG